MSGYYDSAGTWHENVDVSVAAPTFYNTPAISPVPAPASNEVNIEDPSMLDRIFKALANKVTEAGDLAKRVGELEYEMARLRADLKDAIANVEAERAARAQVERDLLEVRGKLEHEQRAVHDLVMERDIVVQERNDAQSQRDAARRESNDWCASYNETQRRLEEERQRNAVLEERCSALAARINALKEAIGGLSAA